MRPLAARSRPFARTVDLRAGLTILELVVVTGIIAILASLLLPAVQQARGAARRLQCKNNLRNVNLALLQVAERDDRFPACGTFGKLGPHHSWVLEILPYLDQTAISDAWNRDGGERDLSNQLLAQTHIAVLTCPDDLSVAGKGDLSFSVNGGVGFTAQMGDGTHDCPVHPSFGALDLNGNGISCPPNPSVDGEPGDKLFFYQMGLFFNET
jgi:type II secretory pathway pseudopilin PulG